VIGIVGLVGVATAGEDPGLAARGAGDPPQKRTKALRRSDQTEVVPEHDHRVEAANSIVQGLKRHLPDDLHASPLAAPDSAGRDVDTDDLMPAALEMECDAAGPAADVEHSPPDEAHRPALDRRPASEGAR